MLGIEPTHREELRKKQGVRLFLEECAIDAGYVVNYFGNKLCDAMDLSIRFSKRVKHFSMANKGYASTILFALLVIFIMMM